MELTQGRSIGYCVLLGLQTTHITALLGKRGSIKGFLSAQCTRPSATLRLLCTLKTQVYEDPSLGLAGNESLRTRTNSQ